MIVSPLSILRRTPIKAASPLPPATRRVEHTRRRLSKVAQPQAVTAGGGVRLDPA